MKRIREKNRKRQRRKHHIRKKIFGTSERPRLSVYRSNRHMYVQAIDDLAGHTLASVSSMEKDYQGMKNSVENAKSLGKVIGERLQEKKVETVVFDRNGYPYHGIVKGIAEGAREAGVKF
jgi:large subunit ribosomal protein L18